MDISRGEVSIGPGTKIIVGGIKTTIYTLRYGPNLLIINAPALKAMMFRITRDVPKSCNIGMDLNL